MHLVPDGDNPLHALYELAREGQADLPASWFRISEDAQVLMVQNVGMVFYRPGEGEPGKVWIGFDSDAHPNNVARLSLFLARHEVTFGLGGLTLYGQYGETLWADFERGTMLFESNLNDAALVPVLAQQGYQVIPYKDGSYRLIKR